VNCAIAEEIITLDSNITL